MDAINDPVAPGALEPPSAATEVVRPVRRRRLSGEPLGYIGALDGLRAVAVLVVCLYHARFGWIPGGFLGVSVFFTLSGFLITSLILRNWLANSRVELRQFWIRRLRRLIPASWATITIVVALGVAGVWTNQQLVQLRGDVHFALLDLLNWHFIAADRSYADQFAAPSPLEHFWSLAVEQQFYVLLPVLMAVVLSAGRRMGRQARLRLLAITLLAITVVSASLNAWLARSSIDSAYYSTFSRMGEFTIGGLLACATLHQVKLRNPLLRRSVIVFGLAGTVVSVALWHTATVRSAWMYPWGLMVAALCSSLIVLAALQPGPVSAVLGWGPLTQLGRISYGVYLLHWPVFLWLTPARLGWAPLPLFALRMLVTVVGAMAMHRIVEQPVRRGVLLRRPRGAIAAGMAAPAIVVSIALLSSGLNSETSLESAAASVSQVGQERRAALRVLVVGDQVAASMAVAIDESAEFSSIDASVPFCGLALGGYVTLSDGSVEHDVDRCRDAHEGWRTRVTDESPDVVVLVPGMRDAAERRLRPEAPWAGPGSPDVDDFLAAEFADSVDAARSSGATVFVATLPRIRNTEGPEPITPKLRPTQPGSDEEVLVLAEQAAISEGAPPPAFAENDDGRIAHLNELLSSVARSSGVDVLDLSSVLETKAGDDLAASVRPDGVKIAPEAAPEIGEWLTKAIRRHRPTPPIPVASPSSETPLPPAPPSRSRRVVRPGSDIRVVIVGDSVGMGVTSGLEKWSRSGVHRLDVRSGTQLGCGITRGGSYRIRNDVGFFAAGCDWGERFVAIGSDVRPDVVVIWSGIWEVTDRRLPGADRFTHLGDASFDHYVLSEFLAAVDALGAGGARVQLVLQPHLRSGLDQGFQDLSESDPARIDRLNELLRQVGAMRPGVVDLVDLESWLRQQPGGGNDSDKRPDGVHFSDEYLPTVAAWLGSEIVGRAGSG